MPNHVRPAVLLGAFAAPLPMCVVLVAVFALITGFSLFLLAYVVIGYLLVWIPMVASYVILRLASWRSLRAYAGVMFIVTFLPMLPLVYRFSDFEPDARVSVDGGSAGALDVEFAITGFVIAGLIALINAGCMGVFWRYSVQACTDE